MTVPAPVATYSSVNDRIWGDAIRDLQGGLRQVGLVWLMAVRSIQNQFHGMTFGLLWISATTTAWILGLGLLWGEIFQSTDSRHIVRVAVGMPVWSIMSAYLISATGAFATNAHLFKQVPAPYSLFALKMLFVNMITAAFRLSVVAVALAWFIARGDVAGVSFLSAVMAVAGMALIFASGFGASLVCGILAARFADVKELVAATLSFLFFVTPVFWDHARLANSPLAPLVEINPLFHYIETVRGSLIGSDHLARHFAVAAACTIAVNLIGFVTFAAFRKRLPYWC